MKIYEILKNVLRKYRNSGEYIDYENTKTILKNDKEAKLVDVRSPQEYREGHLEGAINIPLYEIEKCIEQKIHNKENTIIVYCQSGGRSRKATQILKEKNYINVYQIEGGLDNL